MISNNSTPDVIKYIIEYTRIINGKKKIRYIVGCDTLDGTIKVVRNSYDYVSMIAKKSEGKIGKIINRSFTNEVASIAYIDFDNKRCSDTWRIIKCEYHSDLVI